MISDVKNAANAAVVTAGRDVAIAVRDVTVRDVTVHDANAAMVTAVDTASVPYFFSAIVFDVIVVVVVVVVVVVEDDVVGIVVVVVVVVAFSEQFLCSNEQTMMKFVETTFKRILFTVLQVCFNVAEEFVPIPHRNTAPSNYPFCVTG